MTLDEAIRHELWCTCESQGETAKEHMQMAEWLCELRMLRESSENAKLRELVRNLRACNDSCPRCIELMGKCEYDERMRELGIEIEVDE
jgi:hypothetical protein